jgi:hypothetical protein
MGTRGYYCYRFRGRLYVYYNHWDSYPDILGEFLIGSIPTDPDEYQAIVSAGFSLDFHGSPKYVHNMLSSKEF